ncbi:glycolipid transfer protein 3 isoform X2 [Hevea brasiliensis]|uniref:glycolipid transfer protein 3 isoform X2 n=1 Tax=Hevea brasiliensis TaxID=3981 RepID=UPI0025DF67A1|nr:glycolipid transfer protein 3 isoform X2 [Hevea brasiliensis]
MKRRREMEKGSEIQSAIEELSLLIKLKTSDNHDAALIPTRPFLYVCNLVIQVLDKIGPTMAVLRQDINQNVQKESDEANARKGASCSKAFVWLTRSLDFTVALLQRLVKDPDQEMEEAVKDSYNITLKPWHGWISSAAYRVALKLIPDTKAFINLLKRKDENNDTLAEDMETFISLLVPILEEIHSILIFYRLDKLKST